MVRIVPPFDVAEERESGFGVRGKTMSREALDFEGGEEALGHGVVVRIADSSHTWPHAHLRAALAKDGCCVLATLVIPPITIGTKSRRVTQRLSRRLWGRLTSSSY